jgi:hypothetical protein
MIDLFWQEHSIGLSYQAQRGVSIFLTVNQGILWERRAHLQFLDGFDRFGNTVKSWLLFLNHE